MTHFLRDFHFLSLWVLSWNVNWDFPVVIVINTKRRTWIYTYKDTRTHRENKRTFSLFIFYLHDFLNDQKQGEVFVFQNVFFIKIKFPISCLLLTTYHPLVLIEAELWCIFSSFVEALRRNIFLYKDIKFITYILTQLLSIMTRYVIVFFFLFGVDGKSKQMRAHIKCPREHKSCLEGFLFYSLAMCKFYEFID